MRTKNIDLPPVCFLNNINNVHSDSFTLSIAICPKNNSINISRMLLEVFYHHKRLSAYDFLNRYCKKLFYSTFGPCLMTFRKLQTHYMPWNTSNAEDVIFTLNIVWKFRHRVVFRLWITRFGLFTFCQEFYHRFSHWWFFSNHKSNGISLHFNFFWSEK